MRNANSIKLIRTDFFRLFGYNASIVQILFYTLTTQAKGQGWMLYFRMAQSRNKVTSIIGKIIKRHYSHKYCIDIPTCTKIGKGFYLGHGLCIVIHGATVIGDNCNISQFVNIGTNDDKAPVIGNNVYIGPHVSIVGDVKIGNNVTIGVGAVVTKDIPDNATVAGVPAKILNYDNPGRYIVNKA